MNTKLNFTKEEFEELSAAATHFETAVKQNAKHNSPKWLDEKVKMIYERIAGPQMVNMNCASCIFQLYQKCGRLWLADKIIYSVIAKKEEEEKQKQIEEAEQQTLMESEQNKLTEQAEVTEESEKIEAPIEEEIKPIEEVKVEEQIDTQPPIVEQPKKRGRKPKNNV